MEQTPTQHLYNGFGNALARGFELVVTPALFALIGHFIDLLCKRAHLRPLGRPLVAGINLAADAIDRAVPALRDPLPGSLTANYHVEAIA